MNIPDITISRRLHDALMRDFKPFLKRKVNGKLLTTYLKAGDSENADDQLPLDIRLELAAKLSSALAIEGVGEGAALLQSIDGIIHEGGAPAVVIHGLPYEKKGQRGISLVLMEAFRQMMHDARGGECGKPYGHMGAGTLEDWRDNRTGELQRTGTGFFHHDTSDFVLLYGIRGGTHPRHSPLLDAEDLIGRLVTASLGEDAPPAARNECATRFCMLLKMPIWYVVRTDENKRDFDALESAGLLRPSASGKGAWAPFITDNPNYHGKEPGSVPYRFCKMPFTPLVTRSRFDADHLSDEWKPVAEQLVHAMMLVDGLVEEKTGPVLKEGDLLIFNNHLAMHSGGPFLRQSIQRGEKYIPRLIGTVDVYHNDEPYAVRPGDGQISLVDMVKQGRIASDTEVQIH